MTQTKVEISLVVRDGKGKEKTHTFAKSVVLIGRAVSCDVPLDEVAAGKEHARLEVSAEGAVRLKDLGTSAGTLLNSNKIADSILLSDGDELRIGETTILVRVKTLTEGLAAQEQAGGDSWRTYEMTNRPVVNIAQLWGDAVIAVSRFGKSSRHIVHGMAFAAVILAFEVWFMSGFFSSLKGFYLQGKMADYGPEVTTMVICFLVADLMIFWMAKDLFEWPRQSQVKTVRIGQSKRADFFVPVELLGDKEYNLLERFKGKPALNLANDAIRGKILIDGQVLSVEEVKKTSYIKEKRYLPLSYKTRARLEIGHITFILGLDPSLREPRGAFMSRINVPILASFSLAFFLNALFLLALMAAPKSEPVIRVSASQSRSFKTLIKAEKQKKDEEEKKKEDVEKEKKKEVEEKKDEEKALDEEVEKDPVLEEKAEEEKKVVRTVKLAPQENKSITSDLKPEKKQKKLSSMTTPVSKEKVRSTGALAALQGVGMKVVGSDFGAGGLDIDSSFQPVGDLAISGLGGPGGLDLGTGGDSDPFDLSSVGGSSSALEGEGGPGGGVGGFSASIGADGSAVSGNQLISGKEFEELGKKKVSSSIKNPKFKEKDVKIVPEASFDMSGGGKLDKGVVKSYIRKQLAKIRWCYQKAFQKNPELEGKVTVSFIISPTGSVMSAKVLNSTVNDADLHSCIEQKIMTWRFPAPQGGGVVKVNYPFVLRKQ